MDLSFDETLIHNRRWRTELNKILADPDARDQSRLFLVCYCKEKLKWDIEQICWFLGYYCRWSDYNEKETRRQVTNIFNRYEKGLVGSRIYHDRRFKTSFVAGELNETRPEGKPTETGQLDVVPVRVYSHQLNRCKAHDLFFFLDPPEADTSVGFDRVSLVSPTKGEVENTMEETRIFGKVNDGNRYYRVVEKQGQYGTFISLDSGQLIDVYDNEGKQITGFGKPNKFFTLPKDPEVLKELISAMVQTMPEKVPKKK